MVKGFFKLLKLIFLKINKPPQLNQLIFSRAKPHENVKKNQNS